MDIVVRQAEVKDYPAILRMNEADVEMLSPMDEDTLRKMALMTELFLVVEIDGNTAAFLMVYREGSEYWSENYIWFSRHYPCFLYVDRIVVDKAYREYGLGRRLYEEVFRLAEETEVPLVVAEIDIAPRYNAASMVFHSKMEFHEVGIRLHNETVTVSLQAKEMQFT